MDRPTEWCTTFEHGPHHIEELSGARDYSVGNVVHVRSFNIRQRSDASLLVIILYFIGT